MDFEDDSKPPDILPRQISRFALEKLKKFEWVHLWYFTMAGILDAALSASNIADNSLNLKQTDAGYIIEYAKAAKPSRSAVKDESLKWYQIVEAKHNILEAIAGWPKKNRMALTAFFLQLEKLRGMGTSEKALILYQARIRKLWHAGLKGEAIPFNISNINMNTLAAIENEVRDMRQDDLEEKLDALSHKCDRAATGSERDRGRDVGSSQGQGRQRSSRSRSPKRRTPNRRFRRRSTDGETALPACPVCLSRQRHRVQDCKATTLWDGKRQVRCSRSGEGKIVDPEGRTLCTRWNQSVGCKDKSTRHIHECSGCGKSSHGAQECSLAEKAHSKYPANR